MTTDSLPLSALAPRPLADTLAGVIEIACENAPYIARLIERDGGALDLSNVQALDGQIDGIVHDIRAIAAAPADLDTTSTALRIAKRRAHLLIALADLSGHWPLVKITGALTDLANACVQAALSATLLAHGLASEGMFVIAFGKMGAGELNYSSDIDIAVFYDPDIFISEKRSIGDATVRIVRDMMALMEAQTSEGYVFRTDLRLRPDPSSTPIAVSTRRAEGYYESVGQNWERMVWIKAAPCAGDMAAAARFQASMLPFVWRRHLDYWALNDIQSIKRMINAKVGDPDLGEVDCDVKLGPGGIREVEFFVQTQQIILGGRDVSLRTRGTLEGLQLLVAQGSVAPEVAADLDAAYCNLRALEHRIQMVNDEQTHTLPADPQARGRVARLMGFDTAEALDAALFPVRTRVHEIYEDLFAHDAPDAGNMLAGNLVFTGVDDDPGTVATLKALGFDDPGRVISCFRNWHFGRALATRTRRGQELLTALTPRLLRAMSETGEASAAFANFERFFDGLRSGVQLLSMLEAEQDLLEDLVATLAIAPRLSKILAARPNLLEALVSADATRDGPPDVPDTFEAAMDSARRTHRDKTFLIGHRLLHGRLAARDARAEWTGLARNTIIAMAGAAERETVRRFGPVPGKWAVMGMGSLGAGEMTAGSDLDLIVIYDPEEGGQGAPQTWFTRFTQRLVTALSAPTGEGMLYEVDMRLRPSGRSGPAAVRLSAFERYHNEESWTWEHMALTRTAPICGDVALGQRILDIATGAITARVGRENIDADIDNMRRRLREQRPPSSLWDMKLSDGGLLDIEFIAQRGLLKTGGAGVICPSTPTALVHLQKIGWIKPERCDELIAAWHDQTALQHVLKLALENDGETFSAGLQDRLCRAVNVKEFSALKDSLSAHRAVVLRAG